METPTKRKVAYFFAEDIGNFHFADGHMMKPFRIKMAHELVIQYDLWDKLDVFRPYELQASDMTSFHADDYIDFLEKVTPENMEKYDVEISRFLKLHETNDCPVFDGMFNFCQLYSGGSVGGAYKLARGDADLVVNWAGGLHHAKKTEATGFCYINDIVLAILELLKTYARVLYIDIDIHHGDGVEEAFYLTDRVMTLSIHKGGDFFPGTGKVEDNGFGSGKNYSLNFPLLDGMDDESYPRIFCPLVDKIIENFQPGAIVLQCGADSLAGDRLGCFNLSLKGHGACVEYIRRLNLPLLVLGGGGYTIRNVARCWANETAICAGVPQLSNDIPYHDHYENYAPDYKLEIPVLDMDNYNPREYLDSTTASLLQYLKDLPHAPSVGIRDRDPLSLPAALAYGEDREMNDDPEQRFSQRERDRMIRHESEFYRDEKDQDRERDHERDHDIAMSDQEDALDEDQERGEFSSSHESPSSGGHSIASSLPSPGATHGAVPSSGDGSRSPPAQRSAVSLRQQQSNQASFAPAPNQPNQASFAPAPEPDGVAAQMEDDRPQGDQKTSDSSHSSQSPPQSSSSSAPSSARSTATVEDGAAADSTHPPNFSHVRPPNNPGANPEGVAGINPEGAISKGTAGSASQGASTGITSKNSGHEVCTNDLF